MRDGFMTPPKHVNFEAKKLFGAVGEIIDGSIAYINLNGGGPTEQHTHEHNHLFIVVKGEAKVLQGGRGGRHSSGRGVPGAGEHSHSVWSNQDEETVMVGISVR